MSCHPADNSPCSDAVCGWWVMGGGCLQMHTTQRTLSKFVTWATLICSAIQTQPPILPPFHPSPGLMSCQQPWLLPTWQSNHKILQTLLANTQTTVHFAYMWLVPTCLDCQKTKTCTECCNSCNCNVQQQPTSK